MVTSVNERGTIMELVSVKSGADRAAVVRRLVVDPEVVSERTDWMVETAAGVLVHTFDNEDRARLWLFDRRHEMPGAQMYEVTTTVTRRRVYKPRVVAG